MKKQYRTTTTIDINFHKFLRLVNPTCACWYNCKGIAGGC